MQIRDYRPEFPWGTHFPTHGRDYYSQAMSLFPKETVFIVSTNNPHLAKQCTEGLSDRIIYLDPSDHIENFYTLSLCKSFIISNSTFGWWAAWLSPYANKTIIGPRPWLTAPYEDWTTHNILPEGSIVIHATPL